MEGVKIKKMTTTKNDIRTTVADYEVRSEGEGTNVITGYALKFDKLSTGLYFEEVIQRGALDEADMSNVVALFNHDRNHVLGRVGKNLTLEVDDIGLRFTVSLNNTSYAQDLVENMRSGLVDKCSFAFSIAEGGDEWEKLSDCKYKRTIRKIAKLYDVSVVTTPAYDDTEAVLSQRSLDAYANASNDDDYRKKVLDLEVNLLVGKP